MSDETKLQVVARFVSQQKGTGFFGEGGDVGVGLQSRRHRQLWLNVSAFSSERQREQRASDKFVCCNAWFASAVVCRLLPAVL